MALIGSLSLAAAWWAAERFSDLYFLVAMGAFTLIAVQARARMARVLLAVGLGSLALFWALQTWDMVIPMSVPTLLAVECVLAFLPFGTMLLLLRGTELATGREFPASARVLALGLLAAGTLVRWGAVIILNNPSTTLPTVQYALREDLACVLWGFGGLAAASGFVFHAYQARVARSRRAHRAPLLVTGAVLLVTTGFIGINLSAVSEAKLSGVAPLSLGVHTNDVRDLDPRVTPYAHLEITWDRVETSEGVYNWTGYDEQFRAAEAKGIDLYLLVNTYPPGWLVDKHPTAVMVDQWGHAFTWADEAPGSERSRIWDMSFEHPGVMRAKTGFLKKALERYGEHPSVLFVSVQNEPSYPHDFNLFRFASYDMYTVAAFRQALWQEVDGDLDLVKERYGVPGDTWSSIHAPEVPGGALWERWQRFREDSLVNFVQTLTDTAREHTSKPVTAKVMSHFLARFTAPQSGLSERALRGIVDAVDVVSLDLYPASTGDLERTLQYFKHVANGKPLVVAEFNLLLGVNLPTSGATLLRSLTLMEQYTHWVFLFTVDTHYLYGLDLSEGTVARRVIDLYRTPAWDPMVPMATLGLASQDARNLLNIYPAYVLASQLLSVPVVPWPFLALAIVPAMPAMGLQPRQVLIARIAAAAVLVTLGLLTWH